MLRVNKKNVVISSGFFLLIVALYLKKLDVPLMTEKEKCPACFGLDLCPEVYNGEVQFVIHDFYSIFNYFFSVKNVFYGNYKNKRVILKKLAHESELKHFDEFVCSNKTYFELCPGKSKMINDKVDYCQMISSMLSALDTEDPEKKLRLCPTISKIQQLFKNIQMTHSDHCKHLWTMIQLNPEPIILQVAASNE